MANANTEVSLVDFHQAIVDDIKAAFPALKTVQFYREVDERAPLQAEDLPACLLELTELAVSPDDDPQTTQLPVIARIEARLVIGFRTPRAKVEIRRLAGALAVWLRLRRFTDPNNPDKKLPTGAARVIGCYRDEFEPTLDRFEVWRVEWEQQLDLGESVWTDDGITPVPVYSWVPDIGPGHEDDYQDVVPEL